MDVGFLGELVRIDAYVSKEFTACIIRAEVSKMEEVCFSRNVGNLPTSRHDVTTQKNNADSVKLFMVSHKTCFL